MPPRELESIYLAPVSVEPEALFERDWYLATYPDVAASGGDPLQHYLHHGVTEGRNPNRLFDTKWYLASHPEVNSNKISPLVHYMQSGAARGLRSASVLLDGQVCRAVSVHREERCDSAWFPTFATIMPVDPGSYPDFSLDDVRKATRGGRAPLRAPPPSCATSQL